MKIGKIPIFSLRGVDFNQNANSPVSDSDGL
jgi:hypothetical protein